MSGRKERLVSIEERELQRLREQESRLRSVQTDLPERLNQVREEARREFNQRLAPLEQRTQRQAQDISGLRTNLRDLEQETNRRLQRQQQEFKQGIAEVENRQRQALNREVSRLESAMEQGFVEQRREYLTLLGNQRQEYFRLVDQQDQKFTQLINDERIARQKGQEILQKQIDQVVSNLEQEQQRKDQLARDLLHDVDQIWQQIDRDYQHQRFAPGRLADLRRGLELATNNINAGIPEAAIASCQQTYLGLADLRLELEQKEYEWQLIYHAVLEDLKSLIAEVESNRNCEVKLGEGDDVDQLALEVDYWTDGCLSEYEKQLNQLEIQLKQGEKTLTTEHLQLIGEKINNLQPQLLAIVESARDNILMSQMRVEIADIVAEKLEGFGYRIAEQSDMCFEGDDQRNTYVIKLKNVAGDEVVTVISPQQEMGANSIAINTFSPNLIDEDSARQRSQAIFEALAEEGIKLSPEMRDETQGDVNYRNMEQVKQRQVNRQGI